MDEWARYSAVKQVVEKYWELKDGKNYEDFIKELVMILEL